MDEMTPMSYLIKEDDTFYVVDYATEEKKPCVITKDGICIKMPKNDANRTFFNLKNAEKQLENSDHIDLVYRASRQYGPKSDRLPNEKLIAYLSEEEQAEYKAIIDRARARMNEDRSKNVDVDKLQAKLEKAKAMYEKLLKMAEETGINADGGEENA
jgi:hypothetical protein